MQAEFDEGYYPTGVKTSDEELAAISLHPNAWHGDWNYTLGGIPLMQLIAGPNPTSPSA